MSWYKHQTRTAEEIRELLEANRESGEQLREIDETGKDFTRAIVYGGPDSPTLNITVIRWELYEEGSVNPASGQGFIQHNIEQTEFIVEGRGTFQYGDEAGEAVVAEYDITPGDFVFHEAMTPHKLITEEAPLIGVSFIPTGKRYPGDVRTRTIGSY